MKKDMLCMLAAAMLFCIVPILITQTGCAVGSSGVDDTRFDNSTLNEKDRWGDAEYYEEFEPDKSSHDKRLDSDEEKKKDTRADAAYHEG